MAIFTYGQTELDYLKSRDPDLALAIDRIGRIERAVVPDLFTALVYSVVGQQISNKAAATVRKRLEERLGEITPQTIAAARPEAIQHCGLSLRKAGYIKGIADAVVQGALDLSAFPDLPDEEIVKQLTSLHGLGVWTAEMILIFSMQRPDVVSWGDLAIRRGMIRLYGHATLDRATFEAHRARYSPYGSVASLYLWRIAAEA